jgi:hypothetical protein
MLAGLENRTAGVGRKRGHRIQQGGMDRAAAREEVHRYRPPGRLLTPVERLDLAFPNNLKQFVSVVEAHLMFSRRVMHL